MDDTNKLTPHERLAYLANRLSQTLIPPRHEDLLHAAGEVRDIISELSHRSDNRDGVVAVVCRHYGIEERHLRGKSRIRRHSEPRRVAMHLLRKHSNMTLQDIADEFNRDHTTVIYGLQTVKDEFQRNPAFARNIDMLEALIGKEKQDGSSKEAEEDRQQATTGDQVAEAPEGSGVDGGHGRDQEGAVPQN